MLKIDISKRAAKFLSKLTPKNARQIGTKIQELRLNPTPHDSQLLKGYAPLRRLDIGEFRVIYCFDTQLVIITLVGKRNDSDVYKQLKRL